ncbi:MAG: hypothetical protein DI530_17325 [Sphingomonas sp.]|uniref:Uncharacterized protein n=1 Tax=Variovorax paradoxus TaxID=34073 RepID=A0A2W5QGF9_VARPD|nr:hypothetical protein [Sphingomonas sp.]PZQ76392.1 MAG: hypothetical protein DI563_07125 [Variovorax paradoxus]PZU73555.1 MAG: hypothetical protein DI530_17325 [Sphingomonas sp.]
MALSNEEGRLPTMTMEEFERRATKYVEASILRVESDERTRGLYAYDDAFRGELRKAFHKIMSRRYVLTDASAPAP